MQDQVVTVYSRETSPPLVSKEKKRRSRYIRSNPPPFRMTSRDKRVLEAVYRYRALTSDQVGQLLFEGLHKTVPRKRLSLLYHNGYLDRRFISKVTTEQLVAIPSTAVYLIDRKGNEYLRRYAGESGEDFEQGRWSRDSNRIGYEFIDHLLDMNTFRVAFEVGCHRQSYELLRWIDDTDLKKSYDRVSISSESRPVAVIPDGFARVKTSSGVPCFFLELDRGTMSSKRFRRKVEAYMAYHKAKSMQERFDLKTFRLLTVTLSKRRANALKKITEAIGGKSRFWFGVLSEMTPESVFTESIWQIAGKESPDSLL